MGRKHQSTRRAETLRVRLAWVVLATGLSSPARADEDDPPQVEILESRALVGRGGEGNALPRWDRVQLELHLTNRLPVEVKELQVDVTLVSPTGDAPIAGWHFEQDFDSETIPPEEDTFLRIDHPLPPRRAAMDAKEITYRAHLRGYRIWPPSLELTLRLLSSGAISDQQAALHSYEPPRDGSRLPKTSVDELLAALQRTDLEPNPTNALRILFCIRAAAELQDDQFVPALLELSSRLSTEGWTRPVLELVDRMQDASELDEPRLQVLPIWARKKPEIAAMRAEDIIPEAVRSAVLRIGDLAVPGLVLAAGVHPRAEIRALAHSLLHAMGRSSVRSQLSLSDRKARLAVIEAFGRLGGPEPVAALAELVIGHDHAAREAAMRSLEQIGPEAIDALVEFLGTPNPEAKEALLTVIEHMGAKGRPALLRAIARYGIDVPSETGRTVLARRIAEELSEAATRRWAMEIDRGLRLSGEGRYDEAFRVLDRVYAASPDLYMSYAEPIARVYLHRAEALHASGNYDAAITTLKVGQSIRALPEASRLLEDSRLALARGYIDLDEMDRAAAILDEAEASSVDREVQKLRAKLLARRAEIALSKGEYSKARALVDSARRLTPGDPALAAADRRLVLSENLPIVLVLALLVPGAILAAVLLLRHRFSVTRMRKIETDLDRSSWLPGAPTAAAKRRRDDPEP